MPSDVQWHFIGKLQSNKVKVITTLWFVQSNNKSYPELTANNSSSHSVLKALILGVRNLSVVETLDSLKLARKLNSACEEAKRRTPLGVFIQV